LVSTATAEELAEPNPPVDFSASHPEPIPDEQLEALYQGAVAVAEQLAAAPGKKITVQAREAAYLLQIPRQLMSDISALAIRRVQMRDGHDYMQKGDIDWAWTRLVVGRKNNAWSVLLTTVGSLLFGAGIPLVIVQLSSPSSASSQGELILATSLAIPGVILLTIGLTLSFQRR